MTIKDIARESGYAVGTVSRVLNNHPDVSEKARNKVMEVVDKYHFRLNNNAKHLKQQTNKGIAVIVKGTRNMLFVDMVERLQRLIKEVGYSCLIYYISERENEVEQALQVCRERQPMGILFLGSTQENFVDRFSAIDIPCVLVTNPSESLQFSNLSSVCIDDEEAAKNVMEYLLALGHRKIGLLGGSIKYSNPAKDRFDGCMKALEEFQAAEGAKEMVDVEKYYEFTQFTMEGGYHAMSRLLDKSPEITAVFAMSDVMALGAIRAIKDRGFSVPEDISVVGFDGIEMGEYMVPKLTTIKQPENELAKRSVDILLHCIGEPRERVCEKIPFQFIEGESVCRVR